MKRVVRRNTSMSMLRRVGTCLVGLLLLFSSLLLLALSWIVKHCKYFSIVWFLLVTIGQLKDVLVVRPGHEQNDGELQQQGFQVSDLFFPHRKFLGTSSNAVWKTVVRCNNHTNWTVSRWIQGDNDFPLTNPSSCESEFIRSFPPRSVAVRRSSSSSSSATTTTTTSSPRFQKSKPVQVVLLIGEPSPAALDSSSLSSYLQETGRYSHLYNLTTSELRIHDNIRWTDWDLPSPTGQTENMASLWLGEKHRETRQGRSVTNHGWHPSLLQFGYIVSYFVKQDSPLWLVHVPESILSSSARSPGPDKDLDLSTPNQQRATTKQQTTGSLNNPTEPTTDLTSQQPSSAERRQSQQLTETVAQNDARSPGLKSLQQMLDHVQSHYPGITHDQHELAGIVWWPQRLLGPTGKETVAIQTEYEDFLLDTIALVRSQFKTATAKMILVHEQEANRRISDPSILNHEKLWQQALRAVCGESGKYPALSGNVQSLLFSNYAMNNATFTDASMERALGHGTTMGWYMARLLRRRKFMSRG